MIVDNNVNNWDVESGWRLAYSNGEERISVFLTVSHKQSAVLPLPELSISDKIPDCCI